MAARTFAETLLTRIYQSVIHDLSEPPRGRRILLTGARGFGKTLVLKEVARALDDEARFFRQIDGAEGDDALESLERARTEVSARAPFGWVLLIDNVDTLLFSSAVDRGPGEASFAERTGTCLRGLLPWVRDVTEAQGLLCLSSTLSAIRIQEALELRVPPGESVRATADVFSNLVQRADRRALNPWARDAQTSAKRVLSDELAPCSRKQIVARVVEVVFELTGGHPGLVVPAFEVAQEVAKRLAEERAGTGAGEGEPALSVADDQRIRQTLEDAILCDSFKAPRHFLLSLRRSDEPTRRSAYRCLWSFAQQGTAIPLWERELLMEEGLLYQDDETLTYHIPGSLLLEQIRRVPPLSDAQEPEVSGAGARRPVVTLEPDPEQPTERGTLVIERSGATRRIPLSGGPYVLARLFVAEPAQVRSLKSLVLNQPPLGTEKSARSALQRLGVLLRRHHQEGLLENQYGEGYRFSERFEVRPLAWSPGEKR
ncbi:MAG TPA: AAA family ATPase [Thermoanaerobaculia bacterium]|nr:AAA family ATPase [Thermoanaerobaculia bacterium]